MLSSSCARQQSKLNICWFLASDGHFHSALRRRIICFLHGLVLLDSLVMLPAFKPSQSKMRLLPLIAATYFMVSGGPYGIEDILGGAGYGWAIAILLVLPILWSLPTALMIGELASAIPSEGGFYIWVRRALGPFWGYQESWLSLSASIFDMALYPAIFVLYLGKFSPALTASWEAYAWSREKTYRDTEQRWRDKEP